MQTVLLLDEHDRKILYELISDGRMSLSAIARKLGRSKNFVSKRLQKLKKNGILVDHTLLIDRSKLGYQTYRLYLRVVDREREIIDYLVAKDEVYVVQQVLGKDQLYCSVYTKTPKDIEQLIVELVHKFEGCITKYKLMLVYACYSPAHNYLFKDKDWIHHDVLLFASHKIPLSAAEKMLLQELSRNPRASFSELGKKLRKTPPTTRKLYEGLVEKKVVACIRPSLDIHKLGHLHKNIVMKLKFSGMKYMDEIKTYFLGLRCTKSVSYTLGNFDIIGRFIFEDLHAFKQFQNEFNKRFGDHIEFAEFHDYYKEVKYEPGIKVKKQ